MSNTGYRNTGYRNTGNRNTGYSNTGDRNTGDRNTGNRNTGDWNTGYSNTGDRNTGDRNTGNSNTGDWNTGDCNTGDWNTGDCNTGYFCTDTPCPQFFDVPTTLTWEEAEKCVPYVALPVGATWVNLCDMSDEQKQSHPNARHIGGFLKARDIPLNKAFPIAWAKMTDDEQSKWKALPNFDAEKFLEITGVDVRTPETHEITIDGKSIKVSHSSWLELKAALGAD